MMKKHLAFEKKQSNENEYLIINQKTKDVLGQIYFYKPWDKWVFEPTPDSFFSQICIETILDFIKELDNQYIIIKK